MTTEIPIFDQAAMDRVTDKVLNFDPKKTERDRLAKGKEQEEERKAESLRTEGE